MPVAGGAEADHDGGQPDGEGEPADRLGGQSGHDTGEGLAEHDDDERPEPVGERVGDDQRGRWAAWATSTTTARS